MNQSDLKDAHKMLDELTEDLMKDLSPCQRFKLKVEFKIDDMKLWFINKYYNYVERRNEI